MSLKRFQAAKVLIHEKRFNEQDIKLEELTNENKGGEKKVGLVSPKDHSTTNIEVEKKCAYKYCHLNYIKDREVLGFCTATNYRYIRCKNKSKKWLNDLVNLSAQIYAETE